MNLRSRFVEIFIIVIGTLGLLILFALLYGIPKFLLEEGLELFNIR
ncbi:MAG: hypothetical protein HYV38_01285 [Candidatus Levybacteria bacterium]|nr:hypothetical protein [Candidatus Levybacteria bacterium]MBI2420698.1 hypothetical protein [Candidatus Levybacteria bacterium]